MEFSDHDIVRISEDIWIAMLEMAPHYTGPEPPEEPHGPVVVGIINVSGAWEGSVVLHLDEKLAGEVARRMLTLGDASPTLLDLQDAIGELSNMTGGNIKALAGGECHLSLPTVIQGSSFTLRFPGMKTVNRLGFRVEGLPYTINVLAPEPGERHHLRHHHVHHVREGAHAR
jgi:CheY-specific phosphatase CheX